MAFHGMSLTYDGRNLLSSAQINKAFNIKCIRIGDGKYTGDLKDIHDVVNKICDLPAELNHDGNSLFIECDINSNDHSGYYLREIAIIATDSNGNEIVYAYDNAGEDAEFISANGNIAYENRLRFCLSIMDDIETTIELNGNAYALKKDLKTVAYSGSYTDLNNVPDTFSPSSHTHSRNEINDYTINLTNEDLNIYHGVDKIGFYSAGGNNRCTNKPDGVQGFGLEVIKSADGCYTQVLYSSSSDQSEYIRYYNAPVMTKWTGWIKVSKEGHDHDGRYYTEEEIDSKTNKIELSIENLKENGITAGDTLPIGSVVYFDGTEESLSTGYEKVDMIPPRQLLINNDFQINQRNKSSYTGNQYSVDMWRIASNVINSCQLDVKSYGIDIYNSNEGRTYLTQYIQTNNNWIGKYFTISISINHIVYTYTQILETTTKYIEIENTGLNVSCTYDDTNKRISVTCYTDSLIPIHINYIDLFEGNVAYPHIKEDYAIALLKCREYLVVISDIQRELYKIFGDSRASDLRLDYQLSIPMKLKPTFINTFYKIYDITTDNDISNFKTTLSVYNDSLVFNFKKSDGTYFNRGSDYVVGFSSLLIVSCEPL